VDAARVDDCVAILGSESRRRAELPHLCPDFVAIERKRLEVLVAFHPVFGVVLVGAEIEDGLSARVEWVQLLAPDRPSAVRYPGTGLEIDWIVRRAVPSPVAGGTAEKVKPRRFQREVRLSNDLTAIEILHRRLEVEPSALEKDDTQRGVCPFPRDADSCRASTDDAQVTLDDTPVVQRSGVGVHRASGGALDRQRI